MLRSECTRGPARARPSSPGTPGPPPPSPAPAPAPAPEGAAGAAGALDRFKGRVRDFVAADRRAKELAAELRAARKELAAVRGDVCAFMTDNDIADLHTRDMRLKLSTTEVKAPLSKAELDERVRAFFGGEQAAEDFMERVFRRRDRVSKTSLRTLKARA